MADTVFLDLISSRAWREGLATILLEGEPRSLVSLWLECRYGTRDPFAILEKHIVRGEQVPPWLGNMILASKKPKRVGRHARIEEGARQRAADIVAALAMEDGIRNHGLKPTPAAARAGKALGLSRQAITDAWKRERNRASFQNLAEE